MFKIKISLYFADIHVPHSLLLPHLVPFRRPLLLTHILPSSLLTSIPLSSPLYSFLSFKSLPQPQTLISLTH